MEDIFKFLFVIGIIAIGFDRPGKKRKPVPATVPPCLCLMQKVLFRKIGTAYPMTDITPKTPDRK